METHQLQKSNDFQRKESRKFYGPLCLLFMALTFIVNVTNAEATHHGSTDKNDAVIYVQIPSWKNRTAYPRFLLYRDHLRRRIKSDSVFATEPAHPDSQILQSAILDNDSHSSRQEFEVSRRILPTTDTDASSEEKPSPITSGNEEFIDDEEDLIKIYAELSMRNFAKTPSEAISINANETSKSEDPDKPIKFPKDKTNPFNRLQIDQDQDDGVGLTENPESTSEPTSKELVNSLEIGTRVNFPIKPTRGTVQDDENDDDLVHLLKDAVPTFDLTLKIIELSKWKDENVIFSPMSIANVLSMLLLGSKGETLHELSTLLDKHNHLNESEWDIRRYHDAFRKLNHYFKYSSGKGVDFTTASELFVDKHFRINERYRRELLFYYQANVESLNFETDGEMFKERINRWVREKTHNQIRSILEEAPSVETVLGIINAIYFKGPWEFPFNERFTALREFHVKPKEKFKVLTMINEVKIPYVEKELFQMTTLPYKDNKTALFLILPKGNDGINDLKNVEMRLTKQMLNESIYEMDDTKVTVFLPKLKFSSDGQMKEILENMGLSSLFTPGRADLTGISNTSSLYLSSVVHRAVVEINEKGTEASAVTIGAVDRIFEDPPIPFICNKPFIFFIYHVEADTIIFWGRVTRPDSIPST